MQVVQGAACVQEFVSRGLLFSSRRRHTVSYGDWSSDVCSSDLLVERRQEARVLRDREGAGAVHEVHQAERRGRSEERRVGKEWRSRRTAWWNREKQWVNAGVTAKRRVC